MIAHPSAGRRARTLRWTGRLTTTVPDDPARLPSDQGDPTDAGLLWLQAHRSPAAKRGMADQPQASPANGPHRGQAPFNLFSGQAL